MLSGENKPVHEITLKDTREFTDINQHQLCSKESCRESLISPKTNPIFKVEAVDHTIAPPRAHPKSGAINFHNADLPPSVYF